jgi:hypothetical protein
MHPFAMSIDSYEPAILCMGLLRAPISGVRDALQSQLEKAIKKDAFSSELGEIDWQKFFERDGQFYEIKRFQIALFSPCENLTVYVCNLADGWVSLYGNLVKACALDAYFFRATLSQRTEYTAFEMMGWRHGILKRQVRALQDDDGWKFVNSGEPLPFESPMQYQKRQISARLDRRLLDIYSEAAGYGMGSVTAFGGQCWRFWRDR